MVARQSGPMKMNHPCRLHTTSDAKYTSRRQGRESSRSESLSDLSTDAAEIEIAVRQFRGEVSCKNHINWDSGTVDGGLVGFVFNLTQFTLHLSGTLWTCSDLTGCWRDCSLCSIDMILLPTPPCALRGCLDTGRIAYQTLETLKHYYKSRQLLFIKNYDRQLLQVTRARIVTTYDKVITNFDITSITTLILHAWINECKHFCEHSLSFMPSILSQKNLVELLRSILGTPLTEWLGWSPAIPWYLAQPPILIQ